MGRVFGPHADHDGARHQRERLLAFLGAVVDVVTRNIALLTALDHAITTQKNASPAKHPNTIYQAWHKGAVSSPDNATTRQRDSAETGDRPVAALPLLLPPEYPGGS